MGNHGLGNDSANFDLLNFHKPSFTPRVVVVTLVGSVAYAFGASHPFPSTIFRHSSPLLSQTSFPVAPTIICDLTSQRILPRYTIAPLRYLPVSS